MEADDKKIDVESVISRLADENYRGVPITFDQRIFAFRQLVESGNMPTAVPALPLLLNLNNKPYTLKDHFPFEPIFRCDLTGETLIKSGRQVTKSTSEASRGITISNATPNFKTLFLTPLYEQIRRFSSNYVRKFIETSPVKSLWISTGTINSVLQRSFVNLSEMYFSFALTDADRIRGISADACNFDEVQDMDKSLIPIVKETMSHSPWQLMMYTGTPKTFDNTIEGLWIQSSKAEWIIPCRSCHHENIPRMGRDLEKMIGKWHPDISEARPGTICAKCSYPVFPRDGHWIHEDENRRWNFPGYHIPQIIMPIHYADQKMWSELLLKMQGQKNYTTHQFWNEVLGESYDLGTKLVTQTELQAAACLPWENNERKPDEALKRKDNYVLRVMGVDWGGGGEKETSFTTIAIVGLRPDGKLDVIYGRRFLYPHMKIEEGDACLKIYKAFDCHNFAHDYNGAGDIREAYLVQSGLPLERVVPIVYYRSAARDPMVAHVPEHKHSRTYWHLDKARGLQAVCHAIKLGLMRFFKYDHVSDEDRGLLHDFLSLQENKIESPRGGDIFMIQRNPAFPDDFAHSVTFAACAIWHITQAWPNFAALAASRLNDEQQEALSPQEPWRGHVGPDKS